MSSQNKVEKLLKDKVKSNPDAKAVALAEKRVKEVNERVLAQVAHHEVGMGKRKNIDESVKQMKKQDSEGGSAIDKNLRESKVRQSKQQIAELQSRLSELNSNIDVLSKADLVKDSKRSPKPDLRSGKDRKEWFDQFQKEQESTRDFTKKLNKDKVERNRRERKRIHELEEHWRKDAENQEEMSKKTDKDRSEHLKQQAFDLREKQRKDREEREKFREDTLKAKVKKPLFKQKDEKMRRSMDASMPGLEQRKKELAEKRAMFHPEELQKFAKEDDERLQKLLAERRQKRMDDQKHAAEYKPAELASNYTKRVVQEERQERERQKVKEELPKSMVEKRKNYSQLVKEMYVPKVDDRKKTEMSQMIDRLSTKVRMPKKTDAHSRSVPQSLSSFRHETSDDGTDGGDEDPSKRGKKKRAAGRRRWKENPMVPKEDKTRKEGQKVDYLREIRDKRATDEKNGIVKNYNETKWEKDLEDEKLSKEQKLAKIKAKTDLIEGKARRNEDLLKISGGVNQKDLQVSEEVSDMYVESIKAKLALLDQLQNGK